MIDNYFSIKNAKVSLHFDGFPKDPIKILNAKIHYSNSSTADEKIKQEISASKNPKNIVVVSSDSNIIEFSRKCYCGIVKSEEFANQLVLSNVKKDEESRIDEINNIDEFKKLFGV